MGADGAETGSGGTADQCEVLIVDDNRAVATIISESLERVDEAIQTSYTTKSQRALSRLQQEDVDCLVTDYEMPGIDGLGLIERDGTDTPVVVFTRRREEWLKERVREHGGAFLSKQTGSEQFRELAALIREQARG